MQNNNKMTRDFRFLQHLEIVDCSLIQKYYFQLQECSKQKYVVHKIIYPIHAPSITQIISPPNDSFVDIKT